MTTNCLIGIIGATALGKTKLAAHLASEMDGEIISADSRQIYRGMDIGTGKDLDEFQVEGKYIPYHLIDIADAGEEYNVFQYQMDFYAAYNTITGKGKQAILCGGSGLYIEAALSGYSMPEVPINHGLRKELEDEDIPELKERLTKLKPELHNTTDILEKKRLLRALEIELYKKANPDSIKKSPVSSYQLFGLKTSRILLHERIARRLDFRLKNGLIEEVEGLVKKGIDHEKLKYYGLEYRFVSDYLEGKIQRNDMRNLLLKAIKQFAKKQETWFRRMEKRGISIQWINAEGSVDVKVDQILMHLTKQ